MKLIKRVAFFLFAVICCTSYADESKYIFVGQNESGGSAKTAFILELVGDDLANHVQINENGEVYLKVDKIVAIPKDALCNFASLGMQSLPITAACNSLAISSEAMADDFELDWRCPNPICKARNKAFDKFCRICHTPRP